MQIQRIQTVWLLVATIMMVCFCFSPLFFIPGADGAGEFLYTYQLPIILIVSGLAALLLLLAIFLYNNASRQKMATMIAVVLVLCCIITEVCIFFGWGTDEVAYEWQGSVFLLLGTLIFALMGYRGIVKDEKLLRAADRLR